jgi:hypothetical protein
MYVAKKSIPQANQIEAELLQQGFHPGPPVHLRADIVKIDKRCYGRMECPACRRRAMRVLAFHRGNEYRIVCRCRCGCGVEC